MKQAPTSYQFADAQSPSNWINALIENSPDIILVRDSGKKITHWNKGAESILGYTKQEVIGKTAREIGFLQFDDREMAEIEDSLKVTGQWKSTKNYYTKCGRAVFGAVTANLIGIGDDEAVLFIIKDISQQKRLESDLWRINGDLERKIWEKTVEIRKSESRFKAMAEHNEEAFAMLDDSRKIIYRSPAAAKLTGWSDEDAMQPGFLDRLIHPVDREKFTAYVDAAREHPGKLIHTFYRIITKEGEVRYHEGTLVNLLNETIGAIVSDVRDVTEKVLKQQELEKSRIEIEEREKLLQLYIEHSPAAIAMFDANMHYLVVSSRWLKDYGLEGKKIIGESHFTIFPGIADTWKEVCSDCLKGAARKSEEELFVRADGNYIWIRWEIRPWYQFDGRIGGVLIFSEDITKRKHDEETIAQSEIKYKALMESISDGFIALDKNWRFTYINKVAEQLLKKDAAELLHRNAWDEFPEVRNTIFYEGFQSAMRNRQSLVIEDYSTSLQKWVRIHVYPSEAGLSVFFKDIDGEKQSEIRARQSDDLRKAIMNTIHDAVFCTDQNGGIVYWNRRAEELFGFSQQEMFGRSIFDYILPVKRESTDTLQDENCSKKSCRVILGKLMETKAFDVHGREFPVELFAVRIGDRSDITFCGFIRDISERKKAEEEVIRSKERLQRAQRIGHLGHWEISFKTGESKWSDEAYRIYGLEPADHNISMEEWLTWVHPDDLDRVKEEIENGKTNWVGSSFYHRIIRKDGSVRHVFAESRYEMDENRDPTAMFGIVYDITQLKTLEQELQDHQREEQKKLTAAIIEAEEKERKAIGEELHDNVNQILVSIKILLSTVQSVSDRDQDIVKTSMEHLQLAINENRKIAHERTSPDFTGLSILESLKRLTESMLMNAGVNVRIMSTEINEDILEKDLKLTLYRIAQEQCTNIVKYADAKNVSIKMKIKNNRVMMTISDDGVGADPEKLDNGIGLKNIRSRVSIYNGQVNVATSPGEGFRLSVTAEIGNGKKAGAANEYI